MRHKMIRGIGVVGFCFFLFKGLLWLAIPATLVALESCRGEATTPPSASGH